MSDEYAREAQRITDEIDREDREVAAALEAHPPGTPVEVNLSGAPNDWHRGVVEGAHPAGGVKVAFDRPYYAGKGYGWLRYTVALPSASGSGDKAAMRPVK